MSRCYLCGRFVSRYGYNYGFLHRAGSVYDSVFLCDDGRHGSMVFVQRRRFR